MKKGIFQYAKEQLARHRITKDLGVIYSYMLQAEPWDEETARDLPYVMFTEQLTCDNEKMESVVVVHREMKDEILYPIRDGKAKIQVFTRMWLSCSWTGRDIIIVELWAIPERKCFLCRMRPRCCAS